MKTIKQFGKALKTISLSEKEKLVGRTALLSYMETNPLPASPGFFARFYMLTRRPMWTATTACMLLIAFTGTATYASESSLPGDFLYPFKVEVVEEVQGMFQFDDEARMAWDAKRMERRMNEAKQLEDQGKLNQEIKANLRHKLAEHKKEFEAHLKDLKDQGKPELAEKIEGKFQPIMEEHKVIINEWKPELEFRPLPEQMLPEEQEGLQNEWPDYESAEIPEPIPYEVPAEIPTDVPTEWPIDETSYDTSDDTSGDTADAPSEYPTYEPTNGYADESPDESVEDPKYEPTLEPTLTPDDDDTSEVPSGQDEQGTLDFDTMDIDWLPQDSFFR